MLNIPMLAATSGRSVYIAKLKMDVWQSYQGDYQKHHSQGHSLRFVATTFTEFIDITKRPTTLIEKYVTMPSSCFKLDVSREPIETTPRI